MGESRQNTTIKSDNRGQHSVKLPEATVLGGETFDVQESPVLLGPKFYKAQADWLNNEQAQTAQRQAAAMQVGQMQGNRALQRTMAALRHGQNAILSPNDVQRLPTSRVAQRNDETPEDIANTYEADAWEFYNNNLEIELRNTIAIEGAAISRRASNTAGQMVRDTCEPFERDQELDTDIMNTVFAVTGGGAAMTRSFAPGGRPGPGGGPPSGMNVGSRIVQLGLSLVQVWMPRLAGYRTVGELKDAAVRSIGEEAAQAGETSSAQFGEYETEVMEALYTSWQTEIDSVKQRILTDEHPQNIASIARRFLPMLRTPYLTRIREVYGSQSAHAQAMISAITDMLQPRLDTLREHLEAAQSSREWWQAAGAIGGGVAGGAALGAGIGAFAGGIGAVPGAIIGGAVGLVAGTIGAISILWD